MTLSLPVIVVLPRKRVADLVFRLNLNTYRVTHYHTLDDAKKTYKEIVAAELADNGWFQHREKLTGPVRFRLVLYPARKCDVANVCSIVEKFAADALVEIGVLAGDDCEVVVGESYEFGGYDRKNPRCELTIERKE